MVSDAADLQVWLDTQGNEGMLRIVPYVRSATTMDLKYKLLLTKEGASGRSQVRQEGEVHAVGDEPKALSQLSLGVSSGQGHCVVELTLSRGAEVLGSYTFDCPTPALR